MNKWTKTIGLAAVLAAAIPLSAYAATTGGSSAPTAAATAQPADHDAPKAGKPGGRALVDETVLELLKLDRASLNAKLAEGQTLAEIAAAQGVSRDALKQALTAAFEKRQAAEKASFTASLDSSIDSQHPLPPAGPRGPEGFGVRDLSAAAGALGMTEADLQAALRDGQSLADVAKAKNVDVQQLIDAEKAALTSAINQAVKDGSMTQAEADKALADAAAKAEKIVNDTHPAGPRGPRGPQGPDGHRGGPRVGPHPDSGAAGA